MLTRWNIICRPKDQGGLDIEVLDLNYKCLLRKWLFKLLTEARRRTSGDDEVSVVPLTVGHAASHAPSRRPRSPSPWTGFGSDAPDENLRRAG
jgi:hypothetical protein